MGRSKAATQGADLKKKIVSGGHGNGGKYYALAEFKKCKIINYYEGRLSVFVIDNLIGTPGSPNSSLSEFIRYFW